MLRRCSSISSEEGIEAPSADGVGGTGAGSFPGCCGIGSFWPEASGVPLSRRLDCGSWTGGWLPPRGTSPLGGGSLGGWF